jgi:hypothetical protein
VAKDGIAFVTLKDGVYRADTVYSDSHAISLLSLCKTMTEVVNWKIHFGREDMCIGTTSVGKDKYIFVIPGKGEIKTDNTELVIHSLRGTVVGGDKVDVFIFEYMGKKKQQDFKYITEEETLDIIKEMQGLDMAGKQELLEDLIFDKITEWEDRQEEMKQERTIDHEFLYEKLKEITILQDKIYNMSVLIEDAQDEVGELQGGFNFYLKEQAKQ